MRWVSESKGANRLVPGGTGHRREAQAMSIQEVNGLNRAQLEAEARRLGYAVSEDDTDGDLRSVILEWQYRKAA